MGEYFKEIKVTSKNYKNRKNPYVSMVSKYYYETKIDQEIVKNFSEYYNFDSNINITHETVLYSLKKYTPKPKIKLDGGGTGCLYQSKSDSKYKEKYLKYKTKYLQLKNNQ